MKAITLWQPWASLVALGHKKIETRSWGTKYRGPLAIHAAALLDSETLWAIDEANGVLALNDLPRLPESLPFGGVVALVRLVACRRSGGPEEYPKLERAFGVLGPGRWAWTLEDLRPLDPPIPAAGKQRIWEWEAPAVYEKIYIKEYNQLSTEEGGEK